MATPRAESSVKAFLAALPVHTRELVFALRELVHQAAPGAEETIVWRSLSYHRPDLGGRVKGAVCLITPRPDCVQLGFIHGTALRDPQRLLQGSGRAKRFLALDHLDQVESPAVAALIKDAAAYCPALASRLI